MGSNMLKAIARVLLRALFLVLLVPLSALPIWLMIVFRAEEYFVAALVATIVLGLFLLTFGWSAVQDATSADHSSASRSPDSE